MGNKIYFGLVVCFTYFGCVPPSKPITPIPTITRMEHIYEKNYILGKQTVVSVGDSIIRVKDYFVAIKETDYAEVAADRAAPNSRKFTKGELFLIKGEKVSDDGTHYILLKGNGINLAILPSMLVSVNEYKPNSNKLIFLRKTKNIIDTTKDYINYEIIYSGKTDKTINLTYREYTQDELARPAFSQNLTYDIAAQNIKFKNIYAKIDSASNENIVLRVLAD